MIRNTARRIARSNRDGNILRPAHFRTRSNYRAIGVARNLTERMWFATSYYHNVVIVPKDLFVSHRRDEPAIVTMDRKDS